MKEDRLSGLALMHIHQHVSLNVEDMIVLRDFTAFGRSSFWLSSNCTVSNGRRKSSDSRFHHRKMATAERKMHNDPGLGQGGGGLQPF